jgi:hypothetical protein
MVRAAKLTIVVAILVAGFALRQSAKSQTQPVGFADLESMEVSAKTLQQQVIRRDGRQFPIRQQNDIRLWFKAENKLEGCIELTSHTPKGIRKGKSPHFSFTLEQPQEMKKKFMGEGHAVWFFENGTLINLRTYKGGAFRREIAFVRTADGYSCTIQEAYARETGVAGIELKSAVDGATIMVVSAKQVSSNCVVTKSK